VETRVGVSRYEEGIIYLSDLESLIHEWLHAILDEESSRLLDNLVCQCYPDCTVFPCPKQVSCLALKLEKMGILFEEAGIGRQRR